MPAPSADAPVCHSCWCHPRRATRRDDVLDLVTQELAELSDVSAVLAQLQAAAAAATAGADGE